MNAGGGGAWRIPHATVLCGEANIKPVARPAIPAPESTWVPDRYVQVPGTDGPVMVPGHWERRLSDHEVYTPPLLGRSPNGDIINFPAAVRPPTNERQGP